MSSGTDWLRSTLYIILFLVFLGSVHEAVWSLQERKIGLTSEAAMKSRLLFPSVSMCPIYKRDDKSFHTATKIEQLLYRLRHSVQINGTCVAPM